MADAVPLFELQMWEQWKATWNLALAVRESLKYPPWGSDCNSVYFSFGGTSGHDCVPIKFSFSFLFLMLFFNYSSYSILFCIIFSVCLLTFLSQDLGCSISSWEIDWKYVSPLALWGQCYAWPCLSRKLTFLHHSSMHRLGTILAPRPSKGTRFLNCQWIKYFWINI